MPRAPVPAEVNVGIGGSAGGGGGAENGDPRDPGVDLRPSGDDSDGVLVQSIGGGGGAGGFNVTAGN